MNLKKNKTHFLMKFMKNKIGTSSQKKYLLN